VYGVAHVSGNSFGSVNNFGTTAGAANGASTSATGLSSNSSRVGIKGDEDLGSGLKAVYQFEFGVSMTGDSDSNTKDPSGLNSTRNTFVGVAGGFGTVLAGRNDSFIKATGRKYDLFGDQVGNNRNILGGADATASFVVDGRHNNVLAYVSPSFSGVSFGIAYVGGDAVNQVNAADNAASTSKHAATTAMVDFTKGAFSVTGGYINIGNTTSGTGQALEAYRLGAGYTFGAAKIVALYQNSNTLKVLNGAGSTQDTYGLGGSYKVGAAGTIKAQYYIASNAAAGGANSIGGTLATIGYDHALSKNTTAYVAYAAAHNEAGATYTTDMANGGSGSNVSAVTGKDNSAVSVGVIHNF
jgi:predicted porin